MENEDFLRPSQNKKKKWANEIILLKLQWVFNEDCQEKFSFDFINESLSNTLMKFYGAIGSAMYKISIRSIIEEDNISEVILRYKYLNGLWAAVSLATNRMGIDGLMDFKIKIRDISFIKEKPEDFE